MAEVTRELKQRVSQIVAEQSAPGETPTGGGRVG
jgi:hypothetical protein